MSKLIRAHAVTLLFLIALTAIGTGCHRKRTVQAPKTFPVHGKVVSSTGNIPAGYRIKFTSPDPECSASGMLAADGSFSLTTRYMSVACEGAAKGEYQVSLIPPLNLSNQGVPAAILPGPVRVGPKENELTIPFPIAR